MIANPANGVCRLSFGVDLPATCICSSPIFACYDEKIICIECMHERPTIDGLQYKIKLIADSEIRDFIVNTIK